MGPGGLLRDLDCDYGSHHSLGSLNKPFSFPWLQTTAAASRLEMEDKTSGGPCREKLTGEISAYPSLGDGRTGKESKYNILNTLFFKAEAHRTGASTRTLAKAHKIAQLSNQPKVPSRKANLSTVSSAISESLPWRVFLFPCCTEQ